MAKKEQREAAKTKRAEEQAAAGSRGASAKGRQGWIRRHRGLLSCVGAVAVSLAAWLLAPLAQRGIKVLPVERVAYGDMDIVRFLKEYSTLKPVVLTGAWPEDGWRPAELVASCPKAVIRTFRHDEQSETWARHVQVGVPPLQEYFSKYFEPAFSERPRPLLYGFEMELTKQCPERLEHVRVPSFLSEDVFHLVTNRSGLGWPSVLLGPQGSESGLHIDTHRLPFWLAVVAPKAVGEGSLKRVRIFPHEDAKLLKYGKSAAAANFLFDFDAWQPDYKRFPDLAEGHVFETEMRSGDLLYIPGGSPHAVKNLADNVGVSMNFLDLKTMPAFVKKCNQKSPLCNLLAGKGEWVLGALQERRQLNKDLTYWEFAGITSKQDFCEVHAKDSTQENPLPAFDHYCEASDATE